VVEHDAHRVVLRVPAERLREAVSQLMGAEGISDLTVEDPPLEEVMRELFAAAPASVPEGGEAAR
jgi:ABC-2 type transport system ATP-binding protein